MSDQPVTPAASALTDTKAYPATLRAVERLRALATGNRLDPQTISATASDEAVYTITAELLLQAAWEMEPLGEKQAGALKATPLRDQRELESLRAEAPPRNWADAARAELDGLPGKGWGLDGKRISLPNYTQTYSLAIDCQSCRGKTHSLCATCHGRGKLTCPTCHGAGHLQHTPNTPCPTCHGRNQVDCTLCRGTGKQPCSSCKGKGQLVQYFQRRLSVMTSFRWTGSGVDLPTPLRRSVDRSGLARLANGHATITQLEEDKPDPRAQAASRSSFNSASSSPSCTLRFAAALPFAAVKFTIGGKTYPAFVLGHKGAVLEIKPFLDACIERALARDDYQSLRAFSDAQHLLAQGKKLDAFDHLYPVGISETVQKQVWRRARRAIYKATHWKRWLTLALGVLVSVIVIYGWFTFDWRAPLLRLLPLPKLFDFMLPVILCALTASAAKFVEQRQLRRIYGVRDPHSRKWQWDLLPTFACIIGAFVLYVLYGPVAPQWYAQGKLEAQIEDRARLVDPPVE